MEVIYNNNKIKKICEHFNEAERKFGYLMAEKIHLRIDQILSSESVEMLIEGSIGRCHSLKHNRKGQYAMDLVHPYRLIFEKYKNEINIVNIIEIKDYH